MSIFSWLVLVAILVLFKSIVPLGSIPALTAVSCKEIKMSEGGAISGKYWLTSVKSGIPVLAFCDMITEGE